MRSSTLDALREAYAQVSQSNARALRQLSAVAAAFQQRGIDFLLLKGGDLISRLYGARGLRPMVDLDLLVRPRDLPAIQEALLAMGYEPTSDGNAAFRLPGGLAVDLPTSLWYLEGDALAGIWQRAVVRRIEGQPVKVMGSDDLVIYLTAYAVVHRAALSARFVNDLALLVQKEAVDWDFVVAQAEACALKVPLHHGLRYARWRQARCAVPSPVLRRLAPRSPGEHLLAWLLRKLVTERWIYGTGFLLLFLTQPGLSRWRWLGRLWFPPITFLRDRYGMEAARHPARLRLKRAVALLAALPGLTRHVLSSLLARGPVSP